MEIYIIGGQEDGTWVKTHYAKPYICFPEKTKYEKVYYLKSGPHTTAKHVGYVLRNFRFDAIAIMVYVLEGMDEQRSVDRLKKSMPDILLKSAGFER